MPATRARPPSTEIATRAQAMPAIATGKLRSLTSRLSPPSTSPVPSKLYVPPAGSRV